MATITEPMALDKTFNTTETTPRSQADVLAAIEGAIRQGFGRSAADVSYDNTTSGLTADDVQEAIDELAAEKVDKVAGKGLSTNDYTDEDKEALDNMEFDIAGTQTVSGNPITITDASETYAQALSVELEPNQDLHGYDYPWVGGAGKNKLPMTVEGIKDVNTDGTWSGNVFTHNDGVTFTILTDSDGNVTGINANGTASADILFYEATYLAYGNIVYNGCPSGGSWASYCQVLIPSYTADYGDSESYNFTEESSQVAWIRIASGTSVSNKVFYPMVRPSTETDPTFAPYSNICPITGYDECEVDDVGKNRFDIDSLIAGNIDNNGYDYADGYATYRRTPYIRLKAGNYVIKRIGNTSEWWKGFLYNSQDDHDGIGFVFNTNTDSVATFTAQTDCWLRIAFNYTPTTADQIQLESGSQPTTFVPYSSTSASIQFGQTVYGGRSNFTDGGTDDEIGVVDLGSLNWSYDATQSHPFFYTTDLSSIIKHIIGLPQPLVACEQYRILDIPTNVTDSAWADASVHASMIYHASSPNYVYVRDDRFTDPTDFKNANSGNHLAYMKATPTQLSTPPTDLKLLKGTNNLTTNGTTINLGYQPDNVIGEVKREIEKCAVDAEFMQFTDGTDTFTDVNISLNGSLHTVSVVGSKIEQKRFICFEVMDKMGGVLQGILASCIAFTDGAKTPSGTAFRAYIESLQMYVNFRIYGSGGSYTLAYQSETSFSASAFYVRVRMMNNL